ARIVLQCALAMDFGTLCCGQRNARAFALEAGAILNRAELFDVACAAALVAFVRHVCISLACDLYIEIISMIVKRKYRNNCYYFSRPVFSKSVRFPVPSANLPLLFAGS